MPSASVDQSKPIARPSRRPFVPDGLAFHRREVRKRGTFIPLIAMIAVTIFALLWGKFVDGATGGLGSFALLTLAIPLLPIFGAPTSGGTGTYFLAFVLSAGIWFAVGIVATRRTLLRPIATWREWLLELVPMALAIVLGVVAGLGITAITVL